ncbi:MAG: hypothetical protein WA624_02990 [Methylocella sp.]
MTRALQKHVAWRQDQTFADWFAELRELARALTDDADQAPTVYAVWGGGATPAQALYMVGVILPPTAVTIRIIRNARLAAGAVSGGGVDQAYDGLWDRGRTARVRVVGLLFLLPSNIQGTSITGRPPHRSVRAAFPHTAPTSGV